MNYTEDILVKDYFKVHDFYSKIYGTGKTIIAMRVGSFYEIYNNNTKGLRHLESLAQEINVVCTSKKGDVDISEKNWRMVGFPFHTIDNFIEKIVNLNYTVVIVDQIIVKDNENISIKKLSKSKNGDDFYRKVTRVESPATFINTNKISKVWEPSTIISIYFDKDSNLNNLLIIGMSSYDLFTGKGCFYETYSTKNDVNIALDDTIRFMETYPPKEIIIDFSYDVDEKVSNLTQNEILSYLKISKDNSHFIDVKKNGYHKVKNQINILNKMEFDFNNQLTIIQNLELDRFNWARISLVCLIEFIKNHQDNLIRKLEVPTMYQNQRSLYLGNRALEQLNVLPNSNSDMNKSLFDIINYNKSILGKRFLKDQLVNPSININELNKRYDLINIFLEMDINSHINLYLESIYDIDKIVRKCEMNIVDPVELWKLYSSLKSFNSIIDYFLSVKSTHDVLKILEYSKINIEKVKNILSYFEDTFDLQILSEKKFSPLYNEDNETFFKDGYNDDLDGIKNEIDTCNNFLDNLINGISSLIGEKNYMNKKVKLCDVKFNDRDGHYLILTKRRQKMMIDNINKQADSKNEFAVGSIKMNLDELEFTDLPKSNNVKIRCSKLNNLSGELVKHKINLVKKGKELFYSFVNTFMNNNHKLIKNVSLTISFIDFINSGSLCSLKNHYVKPIINEKSKKSFFDASEMRHPIVEYISEDFKYCPHDISLGKDLNGMLIYGINSSGKSTLMKSIGLNILLAQIGYYVSAKKFEYFPYNNLFTRIVGNDDIYRGLSSFMVEMIELMNILKRNDENTLVIADEICRGTEEKSANILVAYMLETLDKSNTNFLTASHLHKLSTMESVKKLSNVKPYHLKVSYDNENKSIIFDRKLVEGVGENFYGLQVAKYLMNDLKFNNRTNELSKEFDGIVEKNSLYNSSLVLDECKICKSKNRLETHHIKMQKDFNKNEIDENNLEVYKNKLYNLVPLCTSCHDKVDIGLIDIKGYKSTTSGNVLDYQINENKNKKNLKFDNNQLKLIKKISKNKEVKIAKIELLEKHNIKISASTINKVLNNNYC
jgi:DNA mismatch repair protein MutS